MKPKKPMTAYNISFQDERHKMLQEHRKNGSGRPDFTSLAQEISKRWRAITAQERARYERLAVTEKEKFAAKLIKWHEEKNDAADDNHEIKDVSKQECTVTPQDDGSAQKESPQTSRPSDLPEAAEDDFARATFGAKFYDLDMNVCESNETFIDMTPIPYQAPVAQNDYNCINDSFISRLCLVDRSVNAMSRIGGLPFYNSFGFHPNSPNPQGLLDLAAATRPFACRCHCQGASPPSSGPITHNNQDSPGSIGWVTNELGIDGVRMLYNSLFDN